MDSGALAHARYLFESGEQWRGEARRLAEEELRRDSSNYEALELEVEILAASREHSLASRLLEEYIRYYPSDSRASARLAWVWWEEGKRGDAITEVRATLARDPSCSDARRWLVRWALESEDFELAGDAAEEGLSYKPEDRDFLLGLAQAAAYRREEVRARQAFDRTLALYPDGEIACAYGEFLLDLNYSVEAAKLLADYMEASDPPPRLLLRSADAHFRSNQPKQAFDALDRLAGIPSEDAEYHGKALDLMYTQAGLKASDEFCFRKIEEPAAADGFALEFLERCGARNNRGHLNRLFTAFGQHWQRYPRSLARFLSTFYRSPIMPGGTGRWIKQNQQIVQSNTRIWGGVGAFYVQSERWREAVTHLSSYRDRPDAEPWMLLLLGRAHEALRDPASANAVYRDALHMTPDHSESAIRSRLAYNMALDGMPAAGLIIAMDCSEAGKALATVEDMARLAVTEALSRIMKADSAEERDTIILDAHRTLKELARRDPYANVGAITSQFRKLLK